MIGRPLILGVSVLVALTASAAAGEKQLFSWKDTFVAGYSFFQKFDEHPARASTNSTAQYAMLVKSADHDFRICRLHYADDGKTPVGICEDVAGLEDLAKGTN